MFSLLWLGRIGWFQRLNMILAVFASSAVPAVGGDDWPMRGRDQSRNAVSTEKNAPIEWDIAGDRSKSTKVRTNVRWSALLGAESRGDPVIASGLIWVGTNNSRPRNKAESADCSVLM